MSTIQQPEDSGKCTFQISLPTLLTKFSLLYMGDQFAQLGIDMGYDSGQLHITRWWPIVGFLFGMCPSRYRPLLTRFVGSLHESVREERTLFHSIRHPNASLAIIYYFLFPYCLWSLVRLIGIQRKMKKYNGRDLSIVILPYRRPGVENWITKRPFTGRRVVQLKADLLSKWKIDTMGKSDDDIYLALIVQYLQLGYLMGIDPVHLFDESDGVKLPDYTVLVRLLHELQMEWLLPEFHVHTEGNLKVIQEIAYFGTHSETQLTYIIPMISLVKDMINRWVVEIPPWGICAAFGRPVNKKNLIWCHQQILAGLKQVIGNY